jgi:hypothetical protein
MLEREGALKDLRARVDAIREELTTHEMALREKELALEHLIGGVADKFRGLHLPRPVLDKIYRDNAQALFPGAWDLARAPAPLQTGTRSAGAR